MGHGSEVQDSGFELSSGNQIHVEKTSSRDQVHVEKASLREKIHVEDMSQ